MSKQTPAKHNPFQRRGQKGGGLASIRELDSELMHALVYEAAMHAAVISFGVTRDMGAASIAVLLDGELHREYANSPAELVELCHTLKDWFVSLDK